MRLTDDELAARINAICTAPGGLIDLDPRDAQLIACSVLANTILATKWDPVLAFTSAATAVTLTEKAAPDLPKVRRRMA